jgi:hypothetical protein
MRVPMNWRQYEDQTAAFFRRLGCHAEIEARVVGARAAHVIDVWVRFEKFGLEVKWAVECKCWNSAVPKEKVLALQAIVQDVGADRGVLISKSGFQSGALRACQNTNITLTDLEGLQETARDELVSSALSLVETRALELRHAFLDLYSVKQTSSRSWISTPRVGVDGKAVAHSLGQLGLLGFGFDQVRLRKPPYPVRFDDEGQGQIAVNTLDEFVDQASSVINEAESSLRAQGPE